MSQNSDLVWVICASSNAVSFFTWLGWRLFWWRKENECVGLYKMLINLIIPNFVCSVEKVSFSWNIIFCKILQNILLHILPLWEPICTLGLYIKVILEDVRAAVYRCSINELFWKISQRSQEKTCARDSL